MKVLVVAGYVGSIVRFRGALIDLLLKQGMEVHIACPEINSDPGIVHLLTSKGVLLHEIPLYRTGTNPLRDLTTLYALIQLMRNVKPSVILAYTIKPVIYGLLAAWFVKVPKRFALITGLGYTFVDNNSRSLIRRIVQSLYKYALAKADIVFFQNPDDEALFQLLGVISPDAVSRVVNGSGVDISEYRVAELPKKLNFLLIARLLGDKGVREYVQASSIVKSNYPNTRFSLVGWIDENPDSIDQSELDKWVEEGAVDFNGRLQDVRPAIADSSVYVLPSYREGTPRTVLEAMAMGRPVITTDAPGCRETVIEGVNGFLVPVKSVDALVIAMTKFIESPSLISTMGRNSRKIALDKYDVDKVNAYMLKEMRINK